MNEQLKKRKRLSLSYRFPMKWILFVTMFLFVSNGYAQSPRGITGNVTDEAGEPIIGASVKMVGKTTVGTITDVDGNFELNISENGTLEISFIGFKTKKVEVTTTKSSYTVVLKENLEILEEIVVVGYGTQKKVTLTGAVSAINNEQLQLTKTQDTKNMLTGKIPGVRVVQNTSEPGDFGYGKFDIRGYGGSPLIVVDGVPRGNFERLDPNEIESVSVLKDASAAIYGARGGNGVILVTTKKGQKGRAKVEYSMYYGIQTPAEVLKPVGAIDRMTLFNEKSMRSLTNPELTYDDAAFEAYYSGARSSTDWYDAVMAGSAPQQQHNVSVSGGSDKMDYFLNFGYMDQKGFLKSNDLDYNRYNFRSNLNAQVTKNLRLSAKLAFTQDERERPYNETWSIFNYLWRSVPDRTIYANNNRDYLMHPDGNIANPVGMMDKEMSGYKRDGNKILSSSFEGEFSVPWVKGLKLKGLFSYDNTIRDNSQWRKTYEEYTYDEATDMYISYPLQTPTNLVRQYNNNWSTLWQASANYENTFGLHHVTGLMLYEESYSKGDDISANRNFSIDIPYLFAGDSEDQVGTGGNLTEVARRAIVGRFNYDYASKYIAEFSFRYDGSSMFAPGKQWGFFPGVSLGWRMSEETFIKDKLDFVDNLKLRASYGEMGDDSAAAYQFVYGYNYPNTSGAIFNNFPKGYVFDGKVVNALGFRSLANYDITWYKIKTLNMGFDADLWKGLFGFTAEIFQRNRSGLLATRMSTIPGNFGTTMPQENINSDRTKGFELELRHNNKVGDFRYNVTANMSITRSMNRYLQRNPSGNSYANWMARNNTNRYNDIWFGYGDAGRYANWYDIAYSQAYGMNNGSSATLPGDYIYQDWNQDGVIDANDKHPIATTVSSSSGAFDDFQNKRNYPLMNFGLTVGGEWKSLDLNLTFQGSAMSYIAYGEQLASPLAWNGNALDMFMDRWHPADPKQDPYDPSVQWISGYYAYGGRTPDANSTFAIQKGDYIRLKAAELGYTLPQNWLSIIGVQKLRVFASAYNLFTITGVKGVDPEKPAEMYGYLYPLNRSYNFGASITF